MNNTTNQLEYIDKRKKSYSLKYSAINLLTGYNLKDGVRVIELFGGIGISTGIIKEKIKPSSHIIFEIYDDCIEKLRRFSDVAVIKQSAYDFDGFKDGDVIFFDSNSFTMKNSHTQILEKLKDIKVKIILTETGVYHTKFTKEPIELYYDRLDKFFNQYNLNVNEVVYCGNFSIVYIESDKKDIEIYNNEDSDFNFRRFIDVRTNPWF